jgi:hypothetical protein
LKSWNRSIGSFPNFKRSMRRAAIHPEDEREEDALKEDQTSA